MYREREREPEKVVNVQNPRHLLQIWHFRFKHKRNVHHLEYLPTAVPLDYILCYGLNAATHIYLFSILIIIYVYANNLKQINKSYKSLFVKCSPFLCKDSSFTLSFMGLSCSEKNK